MRIYRSHVLVCGGTGCHASGSEKLQEALRRELAAKGLDREVLVVETGCFGFCRFGPNMMVYPEGVFYIQVEPEDVPELVEQHFLKGRVVKELLYHEPEADLTVADVDDIDFFKKQHRLVLENCGVIDPEVIEEYIARQGYLALGKTLTELTPSQVVDIIKASGLRGRGGAGFPTGLKWEFVRRKEGPTKYVICNADEGDPGAFMDRSTLEGDPHRVLEGMTIAAYAVGAQKGYVYIRAEYPIAVRRLDIAIHQARKLGLLGKDIFGSGFDFDVEMRLGAGAFVCGEETALMNSIMGERGEPRPRPPFPADEGLWGKPTLLSNVETYANIPTIIRKGPEWFAQIGTEGSKGTKVFALAGTVINNGLVEVPMGTSLGEIVFDIGGGIPKGKKFKAAQTGGPSWGCIPVQHLNTPVDYESLAKMGTIMGSGGLVVIDEDTCMVDLAKFFLDFVQDESCGKCTPCRIGTKRMLEILERISHGEGQEGDIDLLLELGENIKQSALCGLGQTAPNPVLSTIRYFRAEYEAHIKDKRCPASVCASLFLSPCQNSCPAGVDVPAYLDHIRKGKFLDAYLEIRRENPLPAICGRVCHHPCEGKCRREKLDQALAIRALKRFVSDNYFSLNGSRPVEKMVSAKPTKAAIIGSGPAGLTAAYYLARKGHQVTIFEALSTPGGMLTVGIPEYRLPKDALQMEINSILALGIKLQTGMALGKEFTLADLKDWGFNAVFVAVGAHGDLRLGIEGEDLDGVIPGARFLRELNLGRKFSFQGQKVVVVGGGNVAIDAARSALRLGAEEVTIIYRRREVDMPAESLEIKEVKSEGVKILPLTNPARILGREGKVAGVVCDSMGPDVFDASGRRRTVPTGATFEMEADVVIPAIGQEPELLGWEQELPVGRGNRIQVGEDMATTQGGVFAGGDCVTGPATVVEAIAAGKRAAAQIDSYLGGDGQITEPNSLVREASGELLEEVTPREDPDCLPVQERLGSFTEVERAYAEEAARREAARCLRCDIR
ncbi:MAG: FAD-dependent oxidoreductase [Firmicutes bacterium]|nr:FAD-dependent oxidoreductase [Bacillota bacterium]